MRSTRGIITLIAASGLALTACSANPTASTPKVTTTKEAAAVKATASPNQRTVTGVAWTRPDIEPATDIKVVGNTAFFLGVQKNQLYGFGLDLTTGKDKFRIGASPSGATPGVAVGYGTLGDTVAFYGENEDLQGAAPMWLVNLKTGKQIHTNKTLWRSQPDACDHDRAICGRTDDTTWRADLKTGELTIIDLPVGRQLGNGLSDPLQRDPEMLTYTKDDKQQWSLPLQDLAPGTSTDDGWYTWADDKTHMIGLNLFGQADRIGDTWRVDLAKMRLLGVEEASGHVAWTGSGQLLGCFKQVAGEATKPMLRCSVRGVQSLTGRGTATRTTFTGLDVTVQGFDPKTGRTTWSVPLGNQPSVVDFTGQVPIDNAGRWILPQGSGYLALDPRTGAHDSPVTDDNWCRFTTNIVIRPEMTATKQQRIGAQDAPCDRTGKRRTAQPTTINTTVTPVHSGIALVPGATSLTAYSVRGS